MVVESFSYLNYKEIKKFFSVSESAFDDQLTMGQTFKGF